MQVVNPATGEVIAKAPGMKLRPSAHSHLCQPCAAAVQVVNPATGEVIAKAPGMKSAETQTAIAAAAAAFPTWSRLVAKERCKVMRRRATPPLARV